MIPITAQIALEDDEVQITAVRASGPGGQNVNKVSSAIHLRFDAAGSASLPEDVRARLLAQAGHLLTGEGEIVIKANEFRTQERNRTAAVERLVALIRAAAVPPRPRTATKPSRAAKRRRLESKRHRSSIKRQRGGVTGD